MWISHFDLLPGDASVLTSFNAISSGVGGGPTEDPEGDPATANQQLLTGITRSPLAGGKIIETWTQWDRARALDALGLVPIE